MNSSITLSCQVTFLKLILTPKTKNAQKNTSEKTSAKMERFGAMPRNHINYTQEDFTERIDSVKSIYTVETEGFS